MAGAIRQALTGPTGLSSVPFRATASLVTTDPGRPSRPLSHAECLTLDVLEFASLGEPLTILDTCPLLCMRARGPLHLGRGWGSPDSSFPPGMDVIGGGGFKGSRGGS